MKKAKKGGGDGGSAGSEVFPAPIQPAPPNSPYVKRGRGQPTKLTPDIQHAICEIVATAGSYQDAAVQVGIAIATFQLWKLKGEKAKAEGRRDRYSEFLDALEIARARRRQSFALNLRRHGRKDWRAELALAERTEPEAFRRPRVEIEVFEELNEAADGLEDEFREEPEILERALRAISLRANRRRAASEAAKGEVRPNDPEGGEVVQSAPAVPEAGGVAPA